MSLNVVSLGGRSLPFFYENLRPSDFPVLERQMSGHRFDSALILGTTGRCRFGCPRVIVCRPSRGLVPFPTSFWLTCPWLVRRVGQVEAMGGVRELESWTESHAFHEWVSFNMDHQRVRLALMSNAESSFWQRFRPDAFERLRGTGVGGIRFRDFFAKRKVRVKCVHLQTASWLALRRHPGRFWLEEKKLNGDCGGSMRDFCGGCL